MTDEAQRALNYVDAHDDRASWSTYVAMHVARILARHVREQEAEIANLRNLLLWMRVDSQGKYGVGDALQRLDSAQELYRKVDAALAQEETK